MLDNKGVVRGKGGVLPVEPGQRVAHPGPVPPPRLRLAAAQEGAVTEQVHGLALHPHRLGHQCLARPAPHVARLAVLGLLEGTVGEAMFAQCEIDRAQVGPCGSAGLKVESGDEAVLSPGPVLLPAVQRAQT